MQRQLIKMLGRWVQRERHQLKVMNKMIGSHQLCLFPVCTALEAYNFSELVCLSTF